MAQVILPPGILAIRGRLGNLIYRSRRQPDGTYKVFVHEARSRTKLGPTSVRSRSNFGPTSIDKR